MKLLTFEQYQSFNGKLSEAEFLSHISSAESYVNLYTFNRIDTATRSVQEAVKEIIDLMADMKTEFEAKKQSSNQSGGIRAEASGSYRVEHAQGEQADMFMLERYERLLEAKVRNIILRWLGNTGLMYRGLDRGVLL